MSNLALKYRPQRFSEVVGQDNIVGILMNQLATNNVKQAYLFTGPAGDGKTTTARILANELNEYKGGITEIDAASNNGVDSIRDLRENVKFKPMDTQYRIYVIDECHMLTIGAFNALLKTLEEPPKHAIFILCTTDPQKIPATILSRCQRFDFKRLSVADITARLKFIIAEENIEIDAEVGESCCGSCPEDVGVHLYKVSDEAIDYIAKLANGGMRNAISMLDTCVGYKPEIGIKDVMEILGGANFEVMFDLTSAVLLKKEDIIIEVVEELHRDGKDLKQFLAQYCEFLVDIRKYQILKNFDYIKITSLYAEQLKEVAGEDVKPLMNSMILLANRLKFEANIKPYLIGELILGC